MDLITVGLVTSICVVLIIFLTLILTSKPAIWGSCGLSPSDKEELYIYAGLGHFDITRTEFNHLPKAERAKVIALGKKIIN